MATIANLDDDPTRDALALFDDDDDPFNLPPPLPPLSPHGEDDGTNQDGGAQGDQEAGEGDKKETKKRKVNRSPRPKLDEVRLCGNRGIPALSHLCDDIKFKGKGHEASDLKLLLQRYEHWAHRLFPKFPFADVVDQVENLGSKKLVQNCIKRIRRGEDEEIDDGDRSDTELAQNGETQDDGVLSQVPMTPGINNNQAFGVQVEATDRVVILTPEQQERIRLNRERALAKRKAALERQAQQNNSQADDQTTPAEESAPSAGDVEVAKEDDDTMRNSTDMENDSSVQANDIEMEDDMVDKNVLSVEDNEQESQVNDSETNVEKTESASMALEKENVDQEDIEMGNAETVALESADIVQEESNVPEEDNTNTNETTEDNDLLESAKGLATNQDKADEATVSQVEETPSSSRDDEALHQEGPKEMSGARSTEQAPHENGPDEAQNAEMETEQS